jgi:uncharacterized membrane protein YbhN (UPF0104 family)
MLLAAGISLYLLAPQVLEVFSSWPKLRAVRPLWLGAAIAFEATSYVSFWTLQRIALRTRSWFAVGTAQLAAGAAGSVVPGGGAAAAALQYRLLVRAGIRRRHVGPGLGAALLATTMTAAALPVVAVLAAIGGPATPKGLRQVAYIGGGAFVVVAAGAGAALAWDWPLRSAGRAVRAVASLVGRGERFAELPERLLRQRDVVRAAFAERPVVAVLAAVGKWGFDYLALLCVLASLETRPEPALVLLAYSASALLAMIPLTPGGLGFVEAGLTGLLGLAGVALGVAAVATLAYRLVSFWLPLPVGGIAYLLARRRYGPAERAAATSSETSDATIVPR